MAAPIRLRNDYDGASLRGLAKASGDANQTRRLLALAVIYDGGRRGDAARLGGVGLQVVRDWVLRFNSGGPDGLIDRKAPGQTPKLDAAQRRALARLVEDGPIPAVHGVVRWRLKDLARWIYEEFGVTLDETTLGRTLRAMGFRKLSARPRHYAQNELALEDFKKPSRPRWRRSARHSRPAPRSSSGGRMKRA
jgi:transposase